VGLRRQYGFLPMALSAVASDSDRSMSPIERHPLSRDAAIRRSIATGNHLVRLAQRRVDAARQQVLRADAVVRRVRVYLEQYDAMEPDDAACWPELTTLPDDTPR